MTKSLIWDLPTRLFHWLLVLSLSAQYITAELLDNAMQWHFYVGYFTLGLIVFRILWGFVGTRYAKFRQFIRGPGAVFRYIKSLPAKQTTPHAGHNPLGGWAVVVMLLLITIQATSGLFLTDDVFLDGPYRHMVDESVQSIANTLHHTGFDFLLGIIVAHVLAILFYRYYKHQRLTMPMIHGKKTTGDKGIPSSRLWLALVIAFISAALVYYIIVIAPPEPAAEALYY